MQIEETLQNSWIRGGLQHIAQAGLNLEQIVECHLFGMLAFAAGLAACHGSCRSHETVSSDALCFALPQTWDSTFVDAPWHLASCKVTQLIYFAGAFLAGELTLRNRITTAISFSGMNMIAELCNGSHYGIDGLDEIGAGERLLKIRQALSKQILPRQGVVGVA
jgi:hypothetical protein